MYKWSLMALVLIATCPCSAPDDNEQPPISLTLSAAEARLVSGNRDLIALAPGTGRCASRSSDRRSATEFERFSYDTVHRSASTGWRTIRRKRAWIPPC